MSKRHECSELSEKLSIVGVYVYPNQIAAWTDFQRNKAREWVDALLENDGYIYIPPKPEFLEDGVLNAYF